MELEENLLTHQKEQFIKKKNQSLPPSILSQTYENRRIVTASSCQSIFNTMNFMAIKLYQAIIEMHTHTISINLYKTGKINVKSREQKLVEASSLSCHQPTSTSTQENTIIHGTNMVGKTFDTLWILKKICLSTKRPVQRDESTVMATIILSKTYDSQRISNFSPLSIKIFMTIKLYREPIEPCAHNIY